MIGLQLAGRELEDVAGALDSPEIRGRAKRKLLVLTMHFRGAPHGFTGSCLRTSPPSLASCLKEYQEGALPAVLKNRCGRPPRSLEPCWRCLTCPLTVAPVAGARAAMARIGALSGIKLPENQCRRAMRRMGG